MATHHHPRGSAAASQRCGHRCGIVPPYLLARVAEQAGADVTSALRLDEQFRAQRASLLEGPSARGARSSARPGTEAATPGGPDRLVSDAQGTQNLPGEPARREQDAPTGDPAVDETYDRLGSTYPAFADAFGRAGIDGSDAPQLATVHYRQNYANAFWDGTQMVLGDGDGRVFRRFSLAIDVIGHELGHGVIEYTAQLVYQDQSGALNESIADVFGALTQQHAQGTTSTEADWLIGEGLFTDTVQGRALRSMSEPGTAYDDPVLGTDPQPGHMDDYSDTEEDNGGVHINSGIPNRAFYLAASEIGGNAWEAAGQVWYAVLIGDQIQPDCDFATFAEFTVAEAEHAFGPDSRQAQAIARGMARGRGYHGSPDGTWRHRSGRARRAARTRGVRTDRADHPDRSLRRTARPLDRVRRRVGQHDRSRCPVLVGCLALQCPAPGRAGASTTRCLRVPDQRTGRRRRRRRRRTGSAHRPQADVGSGPGHLSGLPWGRAGHDRRRRRRPARCSRPRADRRRHQHRLRYPRLPRSGLSPTLTHDDRRVPLGPQRAAAILGTQPHRLDPHRRSAPERRASHTRRDGSRAPGHPRCAGRDHPECRRAAQPRRQRDSRRPARTTQRGGVPGLRPGDQSSGLARATFRTQPGLRRRRRRHRAGR